MMRVGCHGIAGRGRPHGCSNAQTNRSRNLGQGMSLKLIRTVRGRSGSAKLYRHDRLGLAEVTTVNAESNRQLIQFRRHDDNMLRRLLSRSDLVQQLTDEVWGTKTKLRRIDRA